MNWQIEREKLNKPNTNENEKWEDGEKKEQRSEKGPKPISVSASECLFVCTLNWKQHERDGERAFCGFESFLSFDEVRFVCLFVCVYCDDNCDFVDSNSESDCDSFWLLEMFFFVFYFMFCFVFVKK